MKKERIPAFAGALLTSVSLNLFADEFALSSPDLSADGRMAEAQVFNGFGCKGSNFSPALRWSHAPAGTKSYVVTVYDPDAPTGSGWWHWVVFNLPADTTGLSKMTGDVTKNLGPAGSVQSRTDYGTPGYGGACPPSGDQPHHYLFTVYALKIEKLPLDSNASPAMVGFYANQNKLATATITVTYNR